MNDIPLRAQVKPEDKWDLSSLFKTAEEWENALATITNGAQKLASFKGRVKENLLEVLALYESTEQLSEKTGNYASLLTAQDESDTEAQNKMGRYMMCASAAEALTSFLIPELQKAAADIEPLLDTDEYKNYAVWLKKLFRLKDHMLSEKEERLFALQSESM